MAEENATEATPESTDAAPKKSGMMVKLILVGVIGTTIAVEVLLAYMFIPSAEQVAAAAQAQVDREMAEEKEAAEEEVAGKEVDLTSFALMAPQPNSNITLRIDFHLWGTVLEEDLEEFTTIFEKKKHRFRDMVITEVLEADSNELLQSKLGLLKRRILEKSNELFGKEVLQSIVVAKYSFVEQ